MTLDERIRSTLKYAASDIPYVPATAPDEIVRRGRWRRARRRTGWGLASAVVVLGGLMVTIPFDPNPRSPATTDGVDTVEIADLAVAVSAADPVSTDPDIWLGLPGPAPTFDTSPLGPDLSFTPGEPSEQDLGQPNRRNDGLPNAVSAVYLGDLEGEPFYVYSAPAPSIWDRIFEVLDGNFSGDVVGTSLNCCSGGDMDHVEGLPGLSHSSTTEGGVTTEVTAAEWLGLSTEVSVVAFRLDGTFIGWQRPVSGVVSLRLDQLPDEYVAVAFDSTGRELQRFGPIRLEPVPTAQAPDSSLLSDTEWAPMTFAGTEIESEDLPSIDLRNAISPQPGDRLFLVPIEVGDIVVRVRDGSPHVFARSCQVLASADLPPGWQQTCLE